MGLESDGGEGGEREREGGDSEGVREEAVC